MRFRSFAADDIFISYTRLDASTYAAGLADELTKDGFSCFIDKLGTDPDKDLPGMLRRKIKSCAMLVIVGTERAATRSTIEDEIREFLLTGQRSSIVPIDFGGAVYNARWYGLVEGVAPEPEKNVDALDDGEPSPPVVSRIKKQFKYLRRNQRLRRLTIGTAALLTLLLIASVVAGVYANQQIASARDASARAERERSDAEVARREAEAARAEADTARNDAQQQRILADKATLEAEEKTRLAEEASLRATAAERAASVAKAEADRQQTIADSRSVANRSQTILRQRPDEVPRSVSLAVESLKTARTVEADTALRESLALLPRMRRPPVTYEGGIIDTALSPDGRHFAILGSDKKLRVYESGTKSAIKELLCKCSALALSNGLRFAVALAGSGIEIFNLQSGKVRTLEVEVEELSENGPVGRIAISPGGHYVALVFNKGKDEARVSRVKVFEAETGKIVETLLQESSLKVNDIAFGATGNLAVGGSELGPYGRPIGRAVIWTLADRRAGEAAGELTESDFKHPIDIYQEHEIRVVAPGADNSYLATDRAVLKRYASREYEPVARIPLPAGKPANYFGERDYVVENLSFDGSGDRLTVIRRYPTQMYDDVASEGSNKGLEEWDASGYWELARSPLLSETGNIAIMPGDQLVPTLFTSDPSASLYLLRSTDGSEVVATVKTESLQAGLFHSDAIPRFLTIGEDSAALQGEGGKKIPAPFSQDLLDVLGGARTPDGKFVVLAGQSVRFYLLTSGEYRLVRQLPVPEPISDVALTPDGQTLVTQTAEAHVIQVWRTSNGLEITPAGLCRLGNMTAWRLSSGGHFLAVTGRGDKGYGVYVWRLIDGVPLVPLLLTEQRHTLPSLAFSSHERFLLASGPGKETRLLELSTQRVRDIPTDAEVEVAAFSEDEEYLGVGTDEGFLLVYSTVDPDNEVARLQHVGRIGAVAFSADGRRLVTQSHRSNPYQVSEPSEFPLRVWLLRPEDLVEEAERRLAALPTYAR
jgi:WD40 repeat protein